MKKALIGVADAAIGIMVYILSQYIVYSVFALAIALRTIASDQTGDCLDNGFNALFNASYKDAVADDTSLVVLISGLITIAILVIIFTACRRSFTENTRMAHMRGLHFVPAVIAGAGFNLLVSTVIPLIPFPSSWVASYTEKSTNVTGNYFALALVTTIIAAPICEEIVFRGVMYNGLKKAVPAWLSALLVSVVFGVMHGTLIWGIYTFFFSLLLIYVEERAGSLWAPIAMHIAFNAAGILLSLLGETNGTVYYIVMAAGLIATAGGCIWLTLSKSYVELAEEYAVSPEDETYVDNDEEARKAYLAAAIADENRMTAEKKDDSAETSDGSTETDGSVWTADNSAETADGISETDGSTETDGSGDALPEDMGEQ